MLLTVLINGYTNENGVNRVIGKIVHNLQGRKFLVKLLSHSLNFSTAPTNDVFLRIDSDDLKPRGPSYGTSNNFYIPSNNSRHVIQSTDYSFICNFKSNEICLELVSFLEPVGSATPIPGAVFVNGMITFNLVEVK